MSSPVARLKIGDIIGGSYRVLAAVAEGGMGAVYKVEQIKMGRICALKTVQAADSAHSQDAVWLEFKQEAQIISRLSHKNIVQVYDFGLTESGTPYYVMDFIEGQSLTNRIKASGQLAAMEAVAIFIEVAEGLAYAHDQGVIHRDVKPNNIMVASERPEGRRQIKIVDFGLATGHEPQPAAQSGEVSEEQKLSGSPPYMSPEQFQNRKLDRRTDIYSFGCSLFEALTGVPPFVGDSALVFAMKHTSEPPPSLAQASFGGQFPEDLEKVMKHLLAKEPAKRYQKMVMVAEDLRAVQKQLAAKQNTSVDERRLDLIDERGASAATALAATQKFDQGITVTPRPGLAIGKILLFAVPLAFIAVSVVAYLTTRPIQQSHDKPVAAEQAVEKSDTTDGAPSDAADKVGKDDKVERIRASAHEKTPFSEIKSGQDGRRMRVFHFPEDISLGTITNHLEGGVQGKRAQGLVIFPAEQTLSFTPSSTTVQVPSFFRRFRPDDLVSLELRNNELLTSESLVYMDHLTSLKFLSLESTDVKDDCLQTVGAFPNLVWLNLSNTELTGAGIAKMANLNHIGKLLADGLNNMTPALKALRHSPNLTILYCEGSTLTREELVYISEIPNLEILVASTNKIGLSGLSILAKCPRLKQLYLPRNNLGSEIIPCLQKFTHLRYVSLGCDGWTNLDVDQLRRALPAVKFKIDQHTDALNH